MKKHQYDKDSSVILKPILGIKPTVYIPFFYGLAILLILAFVVFRSLVMKEGEYIHIKSIPQHAAVYIDDVYIGASPLKTLQKKGAHRLELSLPFYQRHTERYTSDNPFVKFLRVKKREIILLPDLLPDLLTPAFPATDSISTSLVSVESNNLVDYTIGEIASWNIANTETTRQIIPPILETSLEQLYSLVQLDISDKDRENIIRIAFEILYHVMPYLSNKSKNNNVLTSSHASSISKEERTWIKYYEKISQLDFYTEFVRKYQDYSDIVYKTSQLEYFYNSLLKDNARETPTNNGSSPRILPHINSPSLPTKLPNNAARSVTVQGLQFTKIPAQTLYYKSHSLRDAGDFDPIHSYMEFVPDDAATAKSVQEAPQQFMEIQVPDFYIMNTEITQAQYQRFLDDMGISIEEWKTQTKKYVAKDYEVFHFLDFQSSYSRRPLRHITWFDAFFYVEWLNTRLSDSPYEARLPNEYYWNAAVQVYPLVKELGKEDSFIPSIARNAIPVLLGSLWEWGASWYSPNPQYSTFDGPLYGNEKHIFGGSYITKETQKIESTPIYLSRNTAVPPTWANEFIGFRVILVSKTSPQQ